MSEASFQGAILEYAALQGFLAYHTHDSRHSAKGYPDLTLVRGSRLLFAELKTDKGRVSLEQQVWLDALAGAGAEVHIWRPRDWTEILDTLKRPPIPAQTINTEKGARRG